MHFRHHIVWTIQKVPSPSLINELIWKTALNIVSHKTRDIIMAVSQKDFVKFVLEFHTWHLVVSFKKSS